MPTQGLAEWDAKLRRIPEMVKQAARDANGQNALDFMQQVATRVPIGERQPEMVSTLRKTEDEKLGFEVSIGGPEAPYVFHVEAGHMGPGGVHVKAEPFWWTTLRVNKRRFKARLSRAVSTALKTLKAS